MKEIKDVQQLLTQNRLLEKCDVSKIRVIEPLNYDMGKCKIFYDDFVFVFYSTLKKHRDAFIQGCKDFIDTHKDSALVVDYDSYRENLSMLAKKEQSGDDNLLFLEVINSYLELLVLNSTLGSKSIQGEGFTSENEFGTLFWYYLGTKKLSIEEVIDKFKKKGDYILKNIGIKKSAVCCIYQK